MSKLIHFLVGFVLLCPIDRTVADEVSERKALLQASSHSVARIRSVEDGTGFVILTSGRKLYILTAAHVVGGRTAVAPACKMDFGAPELSIPCSVIYAWYKDGVIDLAVLEADARDIPGVFIASRLGDSGLLRDSGAKVFTLGYSGGGPLQRKDGTTRGTDSTQILLNGINPEPGDSGSPLFNADDGTVIGIITDRYRDHSEQRASEIDQIKLYLRREEFFRTLVQFTRPPAGATGPLVSSDIGPSLTNVFAVAASPERWYERAKRYSHSDVEAPKLYGEDTWLGLRRIYVSSFKDRDGVFGHGWATSFDYRVDVERSTICKIYLWNPRGIRIALDTLLKCEDIKRSLVSRVNDPEILDRPLRELLKIDDLAQKVLPDEGPSYAGADYEVARLRFVSGGLELTIGTIKYGFSSSGILRELRSFGRRVEFDYDSKGRLSALREGEQSLEFVYSSKGKVKSATYGDGSQFDYEYDQRDNLTKVTSSGLAIKSYDYDQNNGLTRISSTPDGTKDILIGYGDNGYRVSVRNEAKEFRWSFRDDANGMPIVEQKIIQGDDLPEERRYEFDYQERQLNLTVNGKRTQYALTECLCLPILMKTESGQTKYNYDAFGRVVGLQKTGEEVRLHYDDRVNKVDKIELKTGDQWKTDAEATYDAFGNLAELKTNDESIGLTFDQNRRISSITNKSNGKSSKIEYNRFGKPLRIETAGVGQLVISYQPNGEIDNVDSKDGPGLAIQIASQFSALLDGIGHLTKPIRINTEFALVTSEPGGCGECSALSDF